MNVWFTADLHLGHRMVAELRGFANVADHDEAVLSNWADAVRSDDQVWVLGDLALPNPQYALDEIAALPGHKHLIAGNHDKCHPMHRDSHNQQWRYLQTFKSVQAFARRRFNGTNVLLSHFPYSRDHTDKPRHSQWRLRDEGEWLIHGHTHDNGPAIVGREIHVGLDAWDLTPVPLHEITRAVSA